MDANRKDRGLNRREFLQSTAMLGSAGLAAAAMAGCGVREYAEHGGEYPLSRPENVIYSVCLQCHTDCPIKVKVLDGVAVKIDGNPYGMQTMNPAIPFATAVDDAARIDGGLCPKGQAGLQTLYDPYRITRVLKRAGRRGENRWKVIPFDKAIEEIVEGGKLFADVPGEENRHVPGLREICRATDPAVLSAMSKDAKAVASGKMSVAEFQRKHRENLDLLIDPDHPDLGPVNNQFVFLAGRIEHGRKEFAKRWTHGGLGSINWYEHTTVCEQSHHIAYEKMTEQYRNGKWGGGKHHMKPDLYESEFVIFFGTGAFEANFGPPYLANLVTNRMADQRLRIAVVDPRHSKTAAKAWKWVPVRPGGDAAFAWGMIRWILEHERYDATYLANANRAAANADGETTWSNATWLVRIEDDGPGELLRASDVGLGGEHEFVAMRDGKPVAFDPDDAKRAVDGDLFFDGTVGGVRVKSAMQLVREYAMSHSLDAWAREAGARARDVVALADEFTRHGKRAVAELYRGPVQHTNGYYNGQAIISLNVLIGNADWKGGLSKGGGHWHEDGSKKGQPFPIKSASLHPDRRTAFGLRINREKAHYENSTLFRRDGYPARRPWFPHTGNVYQEVIPSIADGYPYRARALFLHKGTPVYSTAAGDRMIETLVDTDALPLFFACDIVIGETSMYADYIFPDMAIWERWGTPHITPACPVRQSKVRQPAVESPVETVTVFGEEQHVCLESIMLAIAERMGLPGYGPDGFGPGMPLTRPEHFYLKMVANIAAGDKPGDEVPAADAHEFEVFAAARRHLSPAVFDAERWRAAVRGLDGRDWWPHVVTVLNRGGRYEDFDAYRRSDERLPHPFKGMFSLYVEEVARTRHPYTGERFSGLGIADTVRGYDGKPIARRDDALRLITFKEIQGGQSRTLPGNYWLSATIPENAVIIGAQTAEKLGLRDGQRVRLVSPSNPEGVWDLRNGQRVPMEGTLKVVQGLRPGVVAVSWHFGHWAYGANDVVIDGVTVPGDARRRRGLCPNAAMAVDPVLKNVCLEDLIGGSVSFYDSDIELVAV